MEQIPTMVDGLTELAADLFNQIPDEAENAITSTGNTLTNGDLTQLAKAMASYAARGAFYNDSGSANIYTLTLNGAMRGMTSITQGACIRTVIANENTGPSTVQPAGLASTTARRMDGAPLEAGDLLVGDVVSWFYVGAVFLTFNHSEILRRIAVNETGIEDINTFLATLGALAFLDTVDTAQIDDDAVTLAKMASGTAGNLITYNGSSNPVTVATGNNNQVLTSNGAGSPPTFQSLPAATVIAPVAGTNFTWKCFGVQEGNAQTYCMTAIATGTISIGGVIADDGIRFTLTRVAVINTDGADVDIDRPSTGSNFWESGSSGSWDGSFQTISVTAGDRIYFNSMSSYGPGASGACVQVRTGNNTGIPPVN